MYCTAFKWVERKSFVFLNKALRSDLARHRAESHLQWQQSPCLVVVVKYCQCGADLKHQLLFICLNSSLSGFDTADQGGGEIECQFKIVSRIFLSVFSYKYLNYCHANNCRRFPRSLISIGALPAAVLPVLNSCLEPANTIRAPPPHPPQVN